MVDVVRGALGEVEDYQRVDVRPPGRRRRRRRRRSGPRPGRAGGERPALQPATSGSRSGAVAADGGYILAIIDQGVGMTDEQLESANRRLAGEESFTVAPSRYLGHYVAGYLRPTASRSSCTSRAAGGSRRASTSRPPSSSRTATAPPAQSCCPVDEPSYSDPPAGTAPAETVPADSGPASAGP